MRSFDFFKKNSLALRAALLSTAAFLLCLTTKAAPAPGISFPAPDRSSWPAGLQNVPLDRLSSGALMLLDRGGDLVRPPMPPAGRLQAEAAVMLDLRVAPNLRLGDDPDPLPPTMRAQAEPHIARSPVDPELLVAVFQEGRFVDGGGAVDCGYSVTHDGGLTWTRALIPNLTIVTGGPYTRATDPVAGIDLDGRIFLNTLAATGSDFFTGENFILVSRSIDGGATVDSPSIVFQPEKSSDFLDKPWMAVNNFAGTSTAGRILVTWAVFDDTGASPILRSYSDDHGLTWSPALAIHPTDSTAQGAQPMFLPDGRVAIVYWNFAGNGNGDGDTPAAGEEIDMVLSNDGGTSFGAPTLVTEVRYYNPQSIRSGGILPSATTDRTTGAIYVVYQGTTVFGSPLIFFTKSTDAGATWTPPRAITDNPDTGVFNAAISASPDGQTLTVSFYDQRDSGGNPLLCNLYLAQSFDGGETWQPNIRLTSETIDASLAPLSGCCYYMLGDYLGIAPTTGPDVPAVPVWVDTRTGNSDPFITRVGVAREVDFTSFQASRLSLSQIDDPQLGGTTGDADGDSATNLSEFLSGTEPNDPASVVQTSRQLNISTRETVGMGDDVLIGGFIVSGTTPKKVLLRAIGPSLEAFDLTGVLQDPTLELHDASGATIFMNDNWRDTQQAAIEATGIPPNDDRESALVATLDPGAYTAIVRGINNTTGTAVVEAYDLDPAPASKFGNISTRGLVGVANDVLIGGLIISSEESAQANILVRALGPSLGSAEVASALQDPTLELHDSNGATLSANDNWEDNQRGIILSTGLEPNDAREAAIFASLPAGAYTAVVQGNNGTTGIGLVEAYNIP